MGANRADNVEGPADEPVQKAAVKTVQEALDLPPEEAAQKVKTWKEEDARADAGPTAL